MVARDCGALKFFLFSYTLMHWSSDLRLTQPQILFAYKRENFMAKYLVNWLRRFGTNNSYFTTSTVVCSRVCCASSFYLAIIKIMGISGNKSP